MASFAGDTPAIAGMAGEIRNLTESDQFDLGGYTEQRTRDLITAAFGTPLTTPEIMIKVQFVTGGGKLVRSRYDDNLTKWCLGALRDLGFEEDRSAAETFDSQGTFKQQHDTGQNLKYLHVYPHVACANSSSGRGGGEKGSAETVAIDESSPEYIVSASEVATFREIVSSKVASYKQKMSLLKLLQKKAEEFKALEEKLVAGHQLSAPEQAQYDANSGGDMEKIAWLQGEMKTMLDKGHLSKEEKAELLKQVVDNTASTQEELAAAQKEGKAKKVEKLTEKLQKLATRKATIEAVDPMQLRLRLGDKIQAVHMKIFPLNVLEDQSRSMSLTIAKLTILQQKPDFLAEIEGLEKASRGWFEDEETFQRKCAYEQKQAELTYNKRTNANAKKPAAKSGGGGGGGSASRAPTTWATVGKSSGAGVKTSRNAAKKSNLAGGFASAFGGDSDSD